jgi:hypothetical protein
MISLKTKNWANVCNEFDEFPDFVFLEAFFTCIERPLMHFITND